MAIFYNMFSLDFKFLPQAESVADIIKNYQVKEPNFQIHLNQDINYYFFLYSALGK